MLENPSERTALGFLAQLAGPIYKLYPSIFNTHFQEKSVVPCSIFSS